LFAERTAKYKGIGLLFLMWNVPDLIALWNPKKYFLALKLAVTMQFIGLLGESYILSTLTAEYAAPTRPGRLCSWPRVGWLWKPAG
jgi:hypothetical protein